MATAADVEQLLLDLMARFEQLDPEYRAMLPSRRTLQVEFPDLEVVYHTRLEDGSLSGLHTGPAHRADIRMTCSSDDLVAIVAGDLAFRRAYVTNRLRLDASMTDLLRLRGVLA